MSPARELENTIVKPLRGQLIQVSTLKDIHSESRDGAGMIHLSFDFGTNTDLAFIEVLAADTCIVISGMAISGSNDIGKVLYVTSPIIKQAVKAINTAIGR